MIAKTRAFSNLARESLPFFSRILLFLKNNQAYTNDSKYLFTGELPINRHKYDALPHNSRIELLTAIKSLQSYNANSKKTTARNRKLFNLMSWRQQKICEDIGYLDKLYKIEQLFHENQHFLDAVAKRTISDYGVIYTDFELVGLSQKEVHNASSLNYRVVEALGHFVRDWRSDNLKEGGEVQPLVKYVVDQLNAVIPEDERAQTCVILPGSGVGGVANMVAQLKPAFGAVHAVEYSGLMHMCNRFMFREAENAVKEESKEKEDGKLNKFTIYPYIHTNSNFTETANQFRGVEIESGYKRPVNLKLDHEDFRYFKVADPEKFKNIVVVSVFFVDTAENLIDYVDTIKNLTLPTTRNNIDNGYWINVGPLKYGTAARVELTAQELESLRKGMGWTDFDYQNRTGKEELVGYITDKESLWQGYYGLSAWTSARKENKRKDKTKQAIAI